MTASESGQGSSGMSTSTADLTAATPTAADPTVKYELEFLLLYYRKSKWKSLFPLSAVSCCKAKQVVFSPKSNAMLTKIKAHGEFSTNMTLWIVSRSRNASSNVNMNSNFHQVGSEQANPSERDGQRAFRFHRPGRSALPLHRGRKHDQRWVQNSSWCKNNLILIDIEVHQNSLTSFILAQRVGVFWLVTGFEWFVHKFTRRSDRATKMDVFITRKTLSKLFHDLL